MADIDTLSGVLAAFVAMLIFADWVRAAYGLNVNTIVSGAPTINVDGQLFVCLNQDIAVPVRLMPLATCGATTRALSLM